jgi:hypothetical protein
MNTESIPLEPTTETPISNSRESTFTSTKPPEVVMSLVPSSWISSQEPWTPSEPDLSVNSSDLITSSSDKLEPEITGLKVTTPKELNLSTQSSTSSVKKPKVVIASKDSKLPTPSEEELDLVWVPSLSLRSVKNIPIVSWKPSQSSHPQRSLIPSLNLTTPPYLSINWSKTPTNAWSLITKPSTIFASEP